jgi:hypothetical protein
MNNPYKDGICWYGTELRGNQTGKRYGSIPLGICGVQGSPLYEISKPATGCGTCCMYLCNHHAEVMQKRGFTTTKLEITHIDTNGYTKPFKIKT